MDNVFSPSCGAGVVEVTAVDTWVVTISVGAVPDVVMRFVFPTVSNYLTVLSTLLRVTVTVPVTPTTPAGPAAVTTTVTFVREASFSFTSMSSATAASSPIYINSTSTTSALAIVVTEGAIVGEAIMDVITVFFVLICPFCFDVFGFLEFQFNDFSMRSQCRHYGRVDLCSDIWGYGGGARGRQGCRAGTCVMVRGFNCGRATSRHTRRARTRQS